MDPGRKVILIVACGEGVVMLLACLIGLWIYMLI